MFQKIAQMIISVESHPNKSVVRLASRGARSFIKQRLGTYESDKQRGYHHSFMTMEIHDEIRFKRMDQRHVHPFM